MISLRDRWQQSWLHQYFAEMAPIDRATALIVLALLFAWAIAFAGIVSTREPATPELRPSIFTQAGTPV